MARKTKPLAAFGPVFEISAGITFATPFESGCVALASPDQFGYFDGYDSEGVICQFITGMVLGHRDFTEPVTR